MRHPEDDELHEAGHPVPVNGTAIQSRALEVAPQPLASLCPLSAALDPAFELMRARAEGEEKPITTPWPDFNAQMDGGFWPGCHVLVGGTASGKSAWALQLALHAASAQAARVVYVGLELDESQIALRLAGELAGVPWSRLYNGKASIDERERVLTKREQLAALNISIESGASHGWPASRMGVVADAMRKDHPNGPLLFVLDFLQLVGSELNERLELRERIGRAAYAARDIARRYKATVLLICGVARNYYASMNGFELLKEAGLSADMANGILVECFMLTPDAIVGLGKESGEIEYAADSVTVAVSLPRERADGPRQVMLATAKLRAGRPSWSVLEFNGWRFAPSNDGGLRVYRELSRAQERQPSRAKRRPTTAESESGLERCTYEPLRNVD